MNYEQLTANPLLHTDYYNGSHWWQKINQDWEVSHIYNRAQGQILDGFIEQVRDWFGNMKITKEMVDELDKNSKRMNKEADFPIALFMRVVDEFDGRPPIAIEALPDGTYCPTGTPFAQVRNTVKGFGELVTYFEPELLRPAHMSGYSTRGYWANKYLVDRNLTLARFHSFGFRGNATKEGTYWVSRAWNKFLQGTDDLVSTAWTPDNVTIESIAASAHKVIQQFDNEMDAYKFIIDAAKEHKQSVVAMPIDTYDAYRFIREYMVEVANYAKAKGLWVVFRPDSDGPNGEPIIEQAQEMWKVKQANNLDNISVIIGDKMSFKQARIDDETLTNAKIPLWWVRYGIGAGFYNDINRDWAGWSMKTAYSNYDNRMKFAVALKQSIPGAVDLFYDSAGDMYVDLRKSPMPFSLPNTDSLFRVVWSFDGSNVIANTTPDFELWNEIRERALKQDASSQPRIKITPAVQAEISRLRKKYGLDMDTAIFGPQVTSIPDVV